MATAERNLAAAVKAAAERARSELDSHPAPEELVAYQEGRLPPEAMARLQDHLSLCPACAATVLDLESFPEIEARELSLDDPSEEELNAQADEVWEQLRAADFEEAIPPPAGHRPARAIPWPLAASLLLAAVGLALFLPALLGSPPSGFPIWKLAPSEEGYRALDDSTEVPRSAPGEELVVELLVDTDTSYESLEAALLDRSGREIYARGGLHLRDGRVTFLVPARVEVPLKGVWRLDGLEDGRRTKVGEYPFAAGEESGR